MKTKEELNALKNEVEALNKKLSELTDEEMEQVAGGIWYPFKEQVPGGAETQDPTVAIFPGLPAFP